MTNIFGSEKLQKSASHFAKTATSATVLSSLVKPKAQSHSLKVTFSGYFYFFHFFQLTCPAVLLYYKLWLHVKPIPTFPEMSTGYHPRFPGFLTTLVHGFSSKLFYRNLSQKVKGKRPKLTNMKQKDSVDIEGILKRPGAVVGTAEPLVVDTSETTKEIEIKKWQASRQRTNLLKQGERRCTFQVF